MIKISELRTNTVWEKAQLKYPAYATSVEKGKKWLFCVTQYKN